MHARVLTISSVPPGRPPVILVHGLVVSSRYFAPAAGKLAAGFHVYAPDLPGFGKSSNPPRTLNVSQLADALASWIEAVELERPAVLGHSFGCQVVAELAMRYPDSLCCAVLASPTLDRQRRTTHQQALRFLFDAPREAPSLLVVEALDFIAASWLRTWRTLQFALEDYVEEKFPFIQVPTLVVRGGEDPIVPQRWAAEVARLLPHGRLAVVPGAAHSLNYSTSRQFVQAVRPFLMDVASVQAGGT